MTVDGVRLFYTDEGRGDPPLLMIHGWTCDGNDWIWQLPALTESHRVVTVDLRGHGHSSVPDRGYAAADYALDLAQLSRRLDLDGLVAIGHSLGALVATVLAVEHAQLVGGVVIVDPPYGLDHAGALAAQAFATAVGSGSAHELVLRRLADFEAQDTPAAIATWHQRRASAMPRHVLVGTAREAYGAPDSILNRPAADAYLAKRVVPVLALHRNRSRADWESSLLGDPHSRTVVFDGVGHWLHQEKPQEVNAVLIDWLRS